MSLYPIKYKLQSNISCGKVRKCAIILHLIPLSHHGLSRYFRRKFLKPQTNLFVCRKSQLAIIIILKRCISLLAPLHEEYITAHSSSFPVPHWIPALGICWYLISLDNLPKWNRGEFHSSSAPFATTPQDIASSIQIFYEATWSPH